MKSILTSVLILLLTITVFADDDDFIRNLPGNDLLEQLTSDKFPDMDAIIILKEQSFMISPTKIDYKGITFSGPQTVYTKVIIVKLFNETAVKKYGSFEYEYIENFGDEIPNGFTVRARVLKENGDIFVMDKNEVQKVVSRANSKGIPLARKVLFKVPNLAAGDVLQIEYQFRNAFSRSYSGIFFYNDKDFTLYSNLYITLPYKDKFTFVSLPKDRIGEPQSQQASEEFGSGETYFWSLRNLNAIPEEVYSLPFEDRSMITAFVEDWGHVSTHTNTWEGLGSLFFNDFIDKGSISNDEIEKLGFEAESNDTVSFQNIDELYTSIRKYFKLASVNSLYPKNEDISDLYESKKGDASDLSIIMYKVLKEWEVDCNCVMIRDKREGVYEKSIPSTGWFDRLAVLVKINGKEELYDFDRSISTKYSMPWYLNSVNIFVIDEDKSFHKKIDSFSGIERNYESEQHKISFNENLELADSAVFQYKGYFEGKLREKFYDSEKKEIKDYFKEHLTGSCLNKTDSVSVNNLFDENEVDVSSSGSSAINEEIVDSFVVLNIKNTVVKELMDKIYTSSRKTNIDFGTPFQLMLEWEINLPDGYTFYSKNDNQTIMGPGHCNSVITYSLKENKILVDLNMKFADQYLNRKQYDFLIKFIEETETGLEKDIVLEKI